MPRPGEVGLAHLGVLFLDELTEFRPGVLDLLRQPLELGELRLQRARHGCRFPCAITLVGAANPCRCGWHGDPDRECRCSEAERRRYWSRLSGPLLDRIDLQVVMRRPQAGELAAPYRAHEPPAPGQERSYTPESSTAVAQRVREAHHRMAYRNPAGVSNARLAPADLRRLARPDGDALGLWEQALELGRISARGGERVLRVARTISDLQGSDRIPAAALAEALLFRSFDQQVTSG